MNASPASESGPYPTNHRPFFYAHPTAQQPFHNPWILGPMYNPYGIPTGGLRSGNPYFPFYSLPLHEYPGYLVQQHPMHMRVNRRPYFNGHPSSPMFYQATRFRHYSPSKRTETKETQTDPRQPESKPKKYQDHGLETKGCVAGNMGCVPSGTCKGTESSLEKPERGVSSAVSERDFAKNASSAVQFRSLPPSGYAFEKEEVRIEYANGGTPAIQLWKSFKETIPLYDVSKKTVPENLMQRDMFALSSCEGVVYGPGEQGELVPSIPYSEEQEALEDMQEKEPQSKAKLDSEKQGGPSYRAKSPLDEARSVHLAEQTRPDQPGAKQNALLSKRPFGSKRSSGSKAPQDVSNLVRQRELFPSGMEIMNDSYFSQTLNENLDMTTENWTASEKSLWCDESEKYIPSDSWLACLDNVDTNFNYNVYLSQRKRPSVLSLTSDEEPSSTEDVSTDDTPVSYLAPDYVLPKGVCTLKKSNEAMSREKIKSGGSLNEDEVVGSEQDKTGYIRNLKSHSRVKVKEVFTRSRKRGILPRSSSSKQLYSLKKKATKSLSPSEADESEEYWVQEPEEEEEEEEEDDDDNEEKDYLIQEVTPCGNLNPSKSFPFQQTGQPVFWRIPKNAVSGHFINWPVQEKKKMYGLGTKLKKEQEEEEDLFDDYNFSLKRPIAQQLEILEHRRNSPKLSDNLHVDSPKKKGAHKPPHKRRDTRHDAETEEWEKPRTTRRKVVIKQTTLKADTDLHHVAILKDKACHGYTKHSGMELLKEPSISNSHDMERFK
ncbi:uncharacterized protein LOC123017646 [Varanus komodoensis]|uniref:uncharacterized protein LOC123017646 n=1 Tax=Varanus komodoensis TaxID=61221 RepID=UPI001CF77BE4|nr:uncharacterized protein LOC123017646 [Varanus komodoensis]